MRTAGPYSPAVPRKSSQIVLPVPVETAMAAKSEAESDPRPVIGVWIGIIAGSVIVSRRRIWIGRRRRIGARRRRAIGIVVIVRPVISGLAHAGIIGIGIVALDIGGGGPGIVGAHGRTTNQAGARADRSTRPGIAGSGTNGRAQRGTAQGAEDGAIGLLMIGGLARGDIASAGRSIAAAEDVARPPVLRARRRGRIVGAGVRRRAIGTGELGRRRVWRVGLGERGGACQRQRQRRQNRCTDHFHSSRELPLPDKRIVRPFKPQSQA